MQAEYAPRTRGDCPSTLTASSPSPSSETISPGMMSCSLGSSAAAALNALRQARRTASSESSRQDSRKATHRCTAALHASTRRGVSP
eukprot:CAMPEP_0173306120 /NCGR_PEP_ID=MMETSP1143-20121109/20391_1 /TAXON_ID=483371 /ORGANISM="non described non described, Strain CCMP2298" /LENGTH=86 /DNA_ID=CAMNT_0014247151 /DNA_START=105 /DNA_END=362 /DNA_ORIENTATION=+